MGSKSPKTLMLFIDGLGMGTRHPEVNPVYSGVAPTLRHLLDEVAKPIDAGLDVPGRPQSATGQATLLTGKNAAQFMGRHVEGCPGPTLQAFVREHNCFDQFSARGYRSTFSNAYYIRDLDELMRHRRHSVTTVSVLQAFGEVRTGEELEKNEAVYQDLTRASLRQRGYEGSTVDPEEAAEHLCALAEAYDFTLFEYFQTDLMAHRGSEEDIHRVLGEVDGFVKGVVKQWPGEDRLLVITSDHGNVEDIRSRVHTTNPVPFVALGQDAERLRERVTSLENFLPSLLELYPPREGGV